jgi:hypothetical protein
MRKQLASRSPSTPPDARRSLVNLSSIEDKLDRHYGLRNTNTNMNNNTNTNEFKHRFANLGVGNSWISNKSINAPKYTYSFGSLNGTVCYRQVINSMIKMVEYETGIRIEKTNIHENELDEPDPNEHDEIKKELINKAESWTSMRMMHMCTIDYRIDDDRVFSYEQIHELTKTCGLHNMVRLLGMMMESDTLRFMKQ